jgi:serine protease Do
LLSSAPKSTLGELGIEDSRGAFVGHVFNDGPASKGGIKPGDFVTSIDGKSVASIDQLVRIVGDLPVGSKSAFKVIRSGKPLELRITIDERKETSAADYSTLWPGLEVTSLDAELVKTRKLPANAQGIFVTSVIAKSPAATLGIKNGDLIQEMNEKPIKDAADFYLSLNDSKVKSIQFTILREGQTLTTLALVRK